MASSRPPISSAMKPKFSDHFDTWNSSSTGHQTAENRLNSSVGWRHSRSMKLSHQFKSAATGGRGISDRVGAGSGDWDETTNFLIPKDVKAQARISVANMLVSKKHRILYVTSSSLLKPDILQSPRRRTKFPRNRRTSIRILWGRK